MALGPHQDAYARRAHQPALGDVPAGPAQHLVATGGEAGEVGHGAAGDEADGAARGEAEQVDHPRLRHVLDRGVGGGQQPQPGVLVPRADQPVHGQRCRVGAADDEAEEPSPRHRGQPGLARLGQLVDDRDGIGRAVLQVPVEPVQHLLGRHGRRDRSRREGVEPPEGVSVRPVQPGGAVHLGSVHQARAPRRVPSKRPGPLPRTSLGAVRVLSTSEWRPLAEAHAARVDDVRPAAPRPSRRPGEAPGPRLPLHLLLPAPRAAAPLAPRVRRRARGRGGARRASRATPATRSPSPRRTSPRSARCSPSCTRC